MLEIEAKMKIESTDEVARRVRDLGGQFVGEYFESNTFFDTDDRALLAKDQGLRLRVARDMKTGEERCLLTHKGPHLLGPLKTRQETELVVGDPVKATELLEALGYARCLSFQKRRQSWKLRGCKVELDEVPHLGRFIEIEGPSEEQIMALRQALGLAERPLIRSSYIAMLAAYAQERGLPVTDISFPEEEAEAAKR